MSNLSEEEKKAIEWLKKSEFFSARLYAPIILNIISNQQKEIEEKNIAINKMSKDISRQLEEIEEKSTIIMAGAEKVKQLEKEIEEWRNGIRINDKVSIPKDKKADSIDMLINYEYWKAKIEILQELLEEK